MMLPLSEFLSDMGYKLPFRSPPEISNFARQPESAIRTHPQCRTRPVSTCTKPSFG